MQQATIGFRDKSICRRVKFADTSFVAVLGVLFRSSLFLVFRRCPRRHPSDSIASEGILWNALIMRGNSKLRRAFAFAKLDFPRVYSSKTFQIHKYDCIRFLQLYTFSFLHIIRLLRSCLSVVKRKKSINFLFF